MTLRKFKIEHDWLDNPEVTREMTPFHINMLNALENNGAINVRDGVLIEHSQTFWEFHGEKHGRRYRIYVRMLDEVGEFGQKAVPTGRKLAPPKFK